MARFVQKTQCPRCASQGNDTRGDNLAIYEDGSSFCFACSFTKQSPTGSSFFSPSVSQIKTMTLTSVFKIPISQEALDHFGVSLVDKNGTQCVAFPLYDSQSRAFLGNQYRELGFSDSKTSLTREFSFDQGTKTRAGCLFGLHKLSSKHKTLVVVEGTTDALAAYDVFSSPSTLVVGLVSAKFASQAAALIKRQFPRGKVVLYLDADKQGQEAASTILDALEDCRDNLEVVEVIPDEHKDITDSLAAGRTTFETRKSARLTIQTSESLAADFKDFASNFSSNDPISLKFSPSLNKALNIMPGKLITVLGDSGQGKSSLVEQITLEVLSLGRSALFTSVEMSSGEITLKLVRMITGLNLADSVAADRYLESQEEQDIVDKAIRVNLQKLCVGQISSVEDVENHILEMQGIGLFPSVVVVDHILGISGESTASDIEKVQPS